MGCYNYSRQCCGNLYLVMTKSFYMDQLFALFTVCTHCSCSSGADQKKISVKGSLIANPHSIADIILQD